MLSGILNIDKPPVLSSAQTVGKVKRILGTKSCGHMGTLDPMGTGVLLIGVGKGTRLFDYFLGKTKTYTASFKFGSSYDTLDCTGTLTGETSVIPTEEEISSVLPKFLGEQDQLPPLYSAKSVGGERAYDLARKGIAVELKTSRITINSLKLIKCIGENEYLFEIDCSAGTYIRSLARDIGERTGSLAHMTSIRRTRCGNFGVSSSVPLEELKESDIISLDDALSALPRFDAPDSFYERLVNGIRPDCDLTGRFRIYCGNELFGIAENVCGKAKIITYLRESK